MNKKGQVEMADLVGFLLIFIACIIFGFIYMFLSPKANIKAYYEGDNYLAREELVRYLSHEVDGKNIADLVVLAVNEKDFRNLKDKTKELLEHDYKLYIYQEGELLKEMGWGVAPFHEYWWPETFAKHIENFYGPDINVEISVVAVGMVE